MARTYRKAKDPDAQPTRDPNATARAEVAYSLLMKGQTYRQIASALGTNPGTVHRMIQRELQRCISHKVDEYRQIVSDHYKEMLAVYMPRALGFDHITGNPLAKPDGFAADRCATFLEALRKLHAVDVTSEDRGALPVERRYVGVPVEAV